MSTKEFLYSIVGKRTNQQREREKIEILKEIIIKKQRQKAKKLDDYAKEIAEDHYVDNITISKKDGNLLLSTTAKGYPNAIKGSSIYEYIQSEFPEAKMIVVKDDKGYNNLYRHKNNIYNIESDGELSSIELKRIAERMDEGLDDYEDDLE